MTKKIEELKKAIDKEELLTYARSLRTARDYARTADSMLAESALEDYQTMMDNGGVYDEAAMDEYFEEMNDFYSLATSEEDKLIESASFFWNCTPEEALAIMESVNVFEEEEKMNLVNE